MSESTRTPPVENTVRRVISVNGTEIVLEQVTHGPNNLVLLSGGPTRRTSWAPAAALLDGRFSCWLMDRRGKGDSGDTAPYSFDREYDDLAAVAASFDQPISMGGHSSGALCVLGAALRGVPAAPLILYEPPWPLDDDHTPVTVVEAIEAQIAAGNRDHALDIAFLELVGMPPAAIEAIRPSPFWGEFRALVHTWPREMREIAGGAWDTTPLTAITTPTLLLDGALSHPRSRRSTAAIAAALPSSQVTELPGQGHGALRAAPDLIAAAIHKYAQT